MSVIAWIAILAPLPYGLSRLLWAAGIPIGTHEDSLEHMLNLPGWNSLAVLLLVAMAEGTALYTHALIVKRRRSVPAWLPLLGGRRVRPWLAVLPLVAALTVLWGVNRWSLHYVFDGFTMPSEAARDLPA